MVVMAALLGAQGWGVSITTDWLVSGKTTGITGITGKLPRKHHDITVQFLKAA